MGDGCEQGSEQLAWVCFVGESKCSNEVYSTGYPGGFKMQPDGWNTPHLAKPNLPANLWGRRGSGQGQPRKFSPNKEGRLALFEWKTEKRKKPIGCQFFPRYGNALGISPPKIRKRKKKLIIITPPQTRIIARICGGISDISAESRMIYVLTGQTCGRLPSRRAAVRRDRWKHINVGT